MLAVAVRTIVTKSILVYLLAMPSSYGHLEVWDQQIAA